ncbi:MAG: hypothetical protein Q7S40_13620, partial [Opitutaceae bacterium]|nr:hypothetical protein [Opitutaceae bacterium]
PQLSPEVRKNLIEDLNQDGFANLKKLTPADLTLIQRRLALIDQLAPRAKDPINAAAFAEVRKDLVKMRETALRGPPPKKKRRTLGLLKCGTLNNRRSSRGDEAGVYG